VTGPDVYAAGRATLTSQVARAIEELYGAFPDTSIEVTSDGVGGAYIIVDNVELGVSYVQDHTWLGFHISYLYPAADVYPHYVRADLARREGQPLGLGFSITTWAHRNQPATQLSRRSNHWDARRDTAALKALKVLSWLRSQD
jgi:hypothetical protein